LSLLSKKRSKLRFPGEESRPESPSKRPKERDPSRQQSLLCQKSEAGLAFCSGWQTENEYLAVGRAGNQSPAPSGFTSARGGSPL